MMLKRLSIVMLGAALAACDSGPSDSEFQTACLKEGAAGANKALRQEMGLDSEAFCSCLAKEARTRLSAEGRQAMMLDMQGRAQEARAVSAKMSEAQQQAFMEGGMALMEACMPTASRK